MLTKHLGLLSHRAASRCSPAARQLSSVLSSTFDSRRVYDLSTSSPLIAVVCNTIHNRQFSSMGMMPRRGFPQYTIFGPDSALSMRAVLPQFRRAGTDGISVEKRGKLVLEFVPRNASGAGFLWSEKTIFSLSVEEVGLLISQLPGNGVELSHSMNYGVGGDSDESDGVMQRVQPQSGVLRYAGDLVEKVLTILPGAGASLVFKVDYVKDGIGGQIAPQFENAVQTTPIEVTVQAGEFEVLKSIFQTSIPYILGWNTTMDIASAAAMSKGMSGGGGGGGNQAY